MNREAIIGEVMQLPVWDTHTHLDSSEKLCARNIWDIMHYFWYRRELEAAGYPANAEDLPEDSRAEHLVAACRANRNTTWNRAVMSSLVELYGIPATDKKSVEKLNSRISASAEQKDWASGVCDKINVKKITVSQGTENELHFIRDRIITIPVFNIFDDALELALIRFDEANDAIESMIESGFAEIKAEVAAGQRSFRIDFSLGDATYYGRKPAVGSIRTNPDARLYLCHRVLEKLDKIGAHIQIFIGMVGSKDSPDRIPPFARNNTDYVTGMYELFSSYQGCKFEIVSAVELSALDIVQTARIFPNVYPGGLWWFNFRPSTYRANMQYRLEALPANRSTLIASDARCIEWCYIKVRLVKQLLGEFLWNQIDAGWIDEEAALYTAKSWLYDTPARLSGVPLDL